VDTHFPTPLQEVGHFHTGPDGNPYRRSLTAKWSCNFRGAAGDPR
jgi:hypothetical protein